MTILDERIAQLIQADVDGELASEDKAELAAALEQQPEARLFRDEMQRIAKLLSDAPDIDPPKSLTKRILESIELPTSSNLLQGPASWFKPATYSLAMAAGVLLAIGVQRATPDSQPNLASLVGSMVQKQKTINHEPSAELLIEQAEVNGQVVMKNLEQTWMVEFNLQSDDLVEIALDLSGTGLSFGGFANQDSGVEQFQVSEGKVSMMNQGNHHFVLFLRNSSMMDDHSQKIGVEVNHQGTTIYSGLLETRG
jgi:hypothetical protein